MLSRMQILNRPGFATLYGIKRCSRAYRREILNIDYVNMSQTKNDSIFASSPYLRPAHICVQDGIWYNRLGVLIQFCEYKLYITNDRNIQGVAIALSQIIYWIVLLNRLYEHLLQTFLFSNILHVQIVCLQITSVWKSYNKRSTKSRTRDPFIKNVRPKTDFFDTSFPPPTCPTSVVLKTYTPPSPSTDVQIVSRVNICKTSETQNMRIAEFAIRTFCIFLPNEALL